ncbi:hypothetical protein [Arenibacter lacus]|uniref:hypothetical protein n=1 Tax=Arenibacter lacus TaxID=2608629 RepID=UPI00123C86F7|nr:hypothetical protein [Arenibacter lacus]
MHIKNLQRVIFLLAVYVALTPCSIKETIFGYLDVAFERPLNKTRTVQASNTVCELSILSAPTLLESNTPAADILIPKTAITSPIILAGCKKVALKQYAKRTTGNSPPLYILYKRLRSDIA